MKKFLLISALAIFMSVTIMANDLKKNMYDLQETLKALSTGFLKNDKEMVLNTAAKLQMQVKEHLCTTQDFVKHLGDNSEYKSRIVSNSTQTIVKYAKDIEGILADKNSREIDMQDRTQKAFLAIQNECMRCHKLVRDGE